MRIPTFLITGLEPTALDSTALGLLCDLPESVVVRHEVSHEHNTLTRTVSDVRGLLEREVISLGHACIPCAIREDVVPTLARLAATGSWPSQIAVLPSGADARQVCRFVSRSPSVAAPFKIAGVVAALSGETLERDLTGGDLLCERGFGVFSDDRRSVAEVSSALIEYADVVSVRRPDVPHALEPGFTLAMSLARPGAVTTVGWPGFRGEQLLTGLHDPNCSEEWVCDVPPAALPEPAEGTWRLTLSSHLPLHPDRLLRRIADLGSGRFRSRGCFWLPTRAELRCCWDGAGGQLSIGVGGRWGAAQARTHIVVTGLCAHGDPRPRLLDAFGDCLITDEELAERGVAWEVFSDGLEDWLGEIR